MTNEAARIHRGSRRDGVTFVSLAQQARGMRRIGVLGLTVSSTALVTADRQSNDDRFLEFEGNTDPSLSWPAAVSVKAFRAVRSG